jgi:hypothetical protein
VVHAVQLVLQRGGNVPAAGHVAVHGLADRIVGERVVLHVAADQRRALAGLPLVLEPVRLEFRERRPRQSSRAQ